MRFPVRYEHDYLDAVDILNRKYQSNPMLMVGGVPTYVLEDEILSIMKEIVQKRRRQKLY